MNATFVFTSRSSIRHRRRSPSPASRLRMSVVAEPPSAPGSASSARSSGELMRCRDATRSTMRSTLPTPSVRGWTRASVVVAADGGQRDVETRLKPDRHRERDLRPGPDTEFAAEFGDLVHPLGEAPTYRLCPPVDPEVNISTAVPGTGRGSDAPGSPISPVR